MDTPPRETWYTGRSLCPTCGSEATGPLVTQAITAGVEWPEGGEHHKAEKQRRRCRNCSTIYHTLKVGDKIQKKRRKPSGPWAPATPEPNRRTYSL